MLDMDALPWACLTYNTKTPESDKLWDTCGRAGVFSQSAAAVQYTKHPMLPDKAALTTDLGLDLGGRMV